jgi:hypothetical protein
MNTSSMITKVEDGTEGLAALGTEDKGQGFVLIRT